MSGDASMMTIDLAHVAPFTLGAIQVNPATREVLAGGQRSVLEPRVMQVLVALARRRGEVVSRDDLIGSCWGGRAVVDDAVNRCVAALRRLANQQGGFAIETVVRVGYRLTASGDSEPAPTEIKPDNSLESASEPPRPPDKPSIAVMPFANLSGDPEQQYFADGMMDEIVNALSRFKSIFVIASSSTLSFRGKAVSARDAAQLLGVRYILEGSVRKAAERVRILVRLIDPTDGAQIWGARFEDRLEDVFALQDKVALGVAGAIEPALETMEIRRVLRRPTDNMGSYDLVLRAAALMQAGVGAGLFEAHELLARAIALDPGFARALAAKSLCHGLIYSYRLLDDPGGNRRDGVDLAHRAMRLASDDPDVLSITAFSLSLLDEDYDAFLAQIDRALALNPGSSMAWYFSSLMRLAAGDAEAGFEHAQTSLRLDPLSPNKPAIWMCLGCARFEQGRFADAVVFLEQAAQRFDNPDTHAYLAVCRGHLGEITAAREALERYRALSPQALDDLAAVNHRHPGHRKLFLDGVALAEGKTLSDRLEAPA
jgi:TolB-like protein